MKLDGRVAVVTGATRGLGLAISREFLVEGARVLCAARTPGKIEPLTYTHPERVVYHPTDVTDRKSVDSLMQAAVDIYGQLDIVVANAGVNRDGKAESVTDEDWDDMVRTNLNGVFYCTRAAAPHLRENGGCIINISSCMADRVAIGTAGYTATKAAVEAFSRVTAIELGRYAIRVNVLAPGILDAGMGETLRNNESIWQQYCQRFALGRAGEAREAARAAVFLASQDASYVNGEVLAVNGGLLWA